VDVPQDPETGTTRTARGQRGPATILAPDDSCDRRHRMRRIARVK
jgi:hypothetical protein